MRALAVGFAAVSRRIPRPPLLFQNPQTLKNKTLFGLALAWLTLGFAILSATPAAHADAPTPVVVPIALAPVQRTSPIELVALTLDADISESNGHTLLSGNSTFKLHNTDKMNDQQVPVGFPSWGGDPYAFDPARLSPFSVTVDGRNVKLNPSQAELRIGSAVRTVQWYTFTLSIGADEKKTVRYEFQQDLGDSPMPRFVYGLAPAVGWKGSIGSARLTLHFPEMTTPEQIVAYNPADATFDGTSLTWTFTTREPPANPSVTILRPSVWQDLGARRRNAQQNANDSNAHTSLGNILQQLASVDSPRRESYTSQAIAEFEQAARLDPTNRTARQGLAALYELRAGPAAGPRQAAYVSLAVEQWEALAATDANARKQLAEDYFFLGSDAQSVGAFADALAYYDKASKESPGGAGPLYTPDHAASQRRALYIAWARSLLDEQDVASAVDKARAALGDAFIKSLQLPSFYTTGIHVSTTATSRTTEFRLTPYASHAADLQNGLAPIVDSLRAAGAQVTVEPAANNTDTLITIVVPLDSKEPLAEQLKPLAAHFPATAEWALVRAVFEPGDLAVENSNELWTKAAAYRESVDLSAGCKAFQGPLDAVTKLLPPLQSAPANNGEAQLKRALLKASQSGWQAALSAGAATYESGSETQVGACAARTVASSSSSPYWYVLAGLAALVLFIGGGMVSLAAVIKRRK